jgi:hypothetical protein
MILYMLEGKGILVAGEEIMIFSVKHLPFDIDK